MIYGEVMQRWRTASGVVLRKWPREELERWGGWFLFALFAAILVWEEVGWGQSGADSLVPTGRCRQMQRLRMAE